MRNLTVADVIDMPVMDGYRIAAGESGLANEISTPNVYDNPFKRDDAYNDMYMYYIEKSFIITSFYFGKDDPSYIKMVFEYFFSANVSAVCITNEYIDDISDDLKKVCDKNKLPVIFINVSTPYTAIISSIIEWERSFATSSLITNMLNNLVSSKVSESQKLEIIQELNLNLWDTVIAFYAIDAGSSFDEEASIKRYIRISNDIKTSISGFAAEYRNGLLYVASLKNTSPLHIQNLIDSCTARIRHVLPDSIIGVSEPLHKQALGKAVSQAFMSVYSGDAASDNIIHYKSLGLTRLIVAIQDSPALDEFYQETVAPIEAYDREKNAALFDTMVCFMANRMDFSATADSMYVHPNTIRYRLSRMREIMNFGHSEMDFYETLSFIYKIYRIKGG